MPFIPSFSWFFYRSASYCNILPSFLEVFRRSRQVIKQQHRTSKHTRLLSQWPINFIESIFSLSNIVSQELVSCFRDSVLIVIYCCRCLHCHLLIGCLFLTVVWSRDESSCGLSLLSHVPLLFLIFLSLHIFMFKITILTSNWGEAPTADVSMNVPCIHPQRLPFCGACC